MLKRLREALAAIEHGRWSDWQRWLHQLMEPVRVQDYDPETRITTLQTVGYLLPNASYERWARQINTPYAELSEAEKDSDREQVDRYLPLIEEAIYQLAARTERLRQVVGEVRHAVYCDLPASRVPELLDALEDCEEADFAPDLLDLLAHFDATGTILDIFEPKTRVKLGLGPSSDLETDVHHDASPFKGLAS